MAHIVCILSKKMLKCPATRRVLQHFAGSTIEPEWLIEGSAKALMVWSVAIDEGHVKVSSPDGNHPFVARMEDADPGHIPILEVMLEPEYYDLKALCDRATEDLVPRD